MIRKEGLYLGWRWSQASGAMAGRCSGEVTWYRQTRSGKEDDRGRRDTPARLRRLFSTKKKNKILSQFKIPAKPPQHGEVSKTYKKTYGTMADNHIYICIQFNISLPSQIHPPPPPPPLPLYSSTTTTTTTTATLLFYYYNHHHHHLLLLLPPQPPTVLLLPPPQPPTTTTLPNSTSTKTYYHCYSTTHLWCRGLGGRRGVGVGRGAPGTGRGWPRRSEARRGRPGSRREGRGGAAVG